MWFVALIEKITKWIVAICFVAYVVIIIIGIATNKL